MGEQTEMKDCPACGDTFIGLTECCQFCIDNNYEVSLKKEVMEDKIERPSAMDIYAHEVSEARDRYVKAMKKEKLNEDEKLKMYKEEDKGLQSFKEELVKSPEMKKYFDDVQAARENFMKEKLKEHLPKKEAAKFKKYEELADYFSGGDIVKTLYKGHGYADAKFGIMINGVSHWMAEKDIDV